MRRRLTTAWVLGAAFALVLGVMPALGMVSGVAPVDVAPVNPPGRSPTLPFAGSAVPSIIDAPASVVLEALVSDDEFFVFNEQQGLTLVSDLVTDTATITTGTAVDSHFVHFDNTTAGGSSLWNRALGEITFQCPILGVITADATLNATDTMLGATGTTYPGGLLNRGLEFRSDQDMIEVSSDMLTLFVDLQAKEKMDQLRVVTYSCDGFVTGGGWIDSLAGSYWSALGPWFQGFESDTDGWFDATNDWYGNIDRVVSGFGGVSSASGGYHAVMSGDESSAPYSTVCEDDRPTWPGTWNAEIDVWLDPSWASVTGFDYTVAASRTSGAHLRDFIFHVTKGSDGKLLVAGSNNTNFAPREDLGNINHYEVTAAGWYTFRHTFYDQGGVLAVDLDLVDMDGNVLFTETRTDPSDVMSGVGGYRYSWFTFINVDGGIAADNHEVSVDFTCQTPTDLAGKATFGFVSKYKKGATVPTGNTEFQFQAGDLNFHSSSYDWLVVTGSNYAMFKGVGTINGEGEYKFRIWAGDDDPDTFRIKIWTEDALDVETVIYDNGHDQAIGAGSIVIHTKKK